MDMLFDLVRIMAVNIILSGDNAVVIAMCCHALPPKRRLEAMLWGSAGAVVLRLFMTIVAVYLLAIPYLSFIGGLLLIWIAIKLLISNEAAGGANPQKSFWGTVKTILAADVVMSLDNTLAIAAVANGDLLLLAIGFSVSIPIIIFGSRMIISIMERYPLIIYACAMLIAWTAGDLIIHDQQVSGFILTYTPAWGIKPLLSVIVAAAGLWKATMKQPNVNDDT